MWGGGGGGLGRVERRGAQGQVVVVAAARAMATRARHGTGHIKMIATRTRIMNNSAANTF